VTEVIEVDIAPPSGGPEVQADGEYERVYRAEYLTLVSLAFSLTGSRAVAEDLVQEAFLRLHKKWRRVSAYDRPGAWLRRVVLNLATSRARRLVAEARALARLGQEHRAQPALAHEAAEFWEAIRALPRRQAQVLALYYGEDRSVSDVAAVLGCADGTVRAHLHQGRTAVAARLGIEHERDGLR
jgi:RNA polymerase sigma-70 factor (ECF subfamily)